MTAAEMDGTAAGLRIDGLSHRFDRVQALDDVSLDLGEGEILALLGPSGCGKSTLLRLVAGLEPIQRGRIAIGGQAVGEAAVTDLPPEQRDVGFLFQDYALFPHLNVRDNVGFGIRQMPERDRTARVSEILDQVGVMALADAFPHTLSGGQQQRVALARALAPAPRMILLDEPLSGLDARLRHRLADTLLSVLREAGTTAVLVTHDPEEAMYIADRLGVMRDGRLEQIGGPAQVYAAPNSPFVANFLCDSNRLTGQVSSDGLVDTGWGHVQAGDFGPGTAVQVMIRYEGISFGGGPGADGGVAARVLRSRVIGGQSLVALTAETRPEETLFARVPAGKAPQEGDCVAVTLDPAHVFVFSATNAK